MKRFLAIYTGTADAFTKSQWHTADATKRKELEAAGMKAWSDWVATHQASIVEHGGPLGKTKRATKQGIADITNAMAAYTIVQAESHEAAARLFENHPHFTVFPGDGVEIMQCLPIPGQ